MPFLKTANAPPFLSCFSSYIRLYKYITFTPPETLQISKVPDTLIDMTVYSRVPFDALTMWGCALRRPWEPKCVCKGTPPETRSEANDWPVGVVLLGENHVPLLEKGYTASR
jgi:hypothetical protein